MPLEFGSVQKVIGKYLEVEPIYGWGWDYDWVKEPKSFQLKLLEPIISSGGICIGGIGEVMSTQSSYCGDYLVFQLREQGNFDFRDNPGIYNLLFYHEKPPALGKDFFLGGYGKILLPGAEKQKR